MKPSQDWTPATWKARATAQQPAYPDQAALDACLAQVALLPPLVLSNEILTLRTQMAEVAKGARFLLQGGDCSERFDECRATVIASNLRVLLQMSLVLLDASKMKILRIGRVAGQYAKPRSRPTETRGELTLPAYQGDIVNRPGFTLEERTPDPRNLVQGYQYSAITLNFLRGMMRGNFSNLNYPDYWDLGFAESSPHAASYREIIERLSDSLHFVEASVGVPLARITTPELYSSHEALLLPYEAAITRRVPHKPGWFNQGTHFPWIGDRTRQLDGGHVEYMRGIENPIGVKISGTAAPDEVVELVRRLNPLDEPGKVTLTHRFGLAEIERHLPPIIEAVQRAEVSVVWCCDPMHGNTVTTASGRKTRVFDDVLGEVRRAFEIHGRMGTFLGGVQLEITGEQVTECIGGARNLTEQDLDQTYRSLIDPRLNQEQALEMALQIAQVMRRWRGSRRAT